MLKWMWLLAISIVLDIEGIAFIRIGDLGIAARIAMATMIILQVILFFLVCFLYTLKAYRNMKN